MKKPRLIAGILFALAFALLTSACTSAQAGSTRIRELHTYAIVAVDDQGVLSQAELARIRIGIVQYLTDEGYVRSGQVFTDDVVHAEVVFRVRIVWMDEGKSFAVFILIGLMECDGVEKKRSFVPMKSPRDFI